MVAMHGLSPLTLIFAFTVISLAKYATAQPSRCQTGQNLGQCTTISPGTPPFESIDMKACQPDRTIDGSCTNFRYSTVGTAGMAHYSYFPFYSSTEMNGQDRKSARLISNVVSEQTESMLNDRGLTEFLVFFGQFIDHCTVQTKVDADQTPVPIPVPADDPLFTNIQELPFSRSAREARPEDPTLEAPANLLSSALDLAAVYSSNKKRLKELRDGKTCFLKTSGDGHLPKNDAGFLNEPSTSSAFYFGGDIRANENLALTALQTIFLREHNRWCNLLIPHFGNGKAAFREARKINIAQFQKIVFEEFVPAITGRQLPGWRFEMETNASVSVLFSTAAFRLGHTMIGDGLQLRGPGNTLLSTIPASEMFFRPASVFESFGAEPFIRGSVQQRAQEVDTKVMDSLRQILFTNVPGLGEGIDLVALNLQRGRDHALPSYNTVRGHFGLPALTSFPQVTSSEELQGKLLQVYDSPDDMDIWIALLAEDHEPGSSMGPTMLRIWLEEFRRLRNGDWLYFQRSRHFNGITIEVFPELRNLRSQDNLMREIILRNTDIAESDLPANVFKL